MIGPRGAALVKAAESLRLTAYLCPAGLPTIGWGSTHLVELGTTCTLEEAEARFVQDTAAAESRVDHLVTVPITEGMRDALVSFKFNTKAGAFEKSTLLRKLNAGDYTGAAAEFKRWDKATNPKTGLLVKLLGLQRRRAAEAALFMEDGLPASQAPRGETI